MKLGDILATSSACCALLACSAPPPRPAPAGAPAGLASTQPRPAPPGRDDPGAAEALAGRVLEFHTVRRPTIAVVLDSRREVWLDGSRPGADVLMATLAEAWRLSVPIVARTAGSRIVAVEGVVPPDVKALPAPQASGPLAFVDRDVVGSLITQDRGVYPSGGPGIQVTFARHAALYTLSTDAPALAAQVTALAVSWWSAAPVAFRDAPGAQIVVVGSAAAGPSPAVPVAPGW